MAESSNRSSTRTGVDVAIVGAGIAGLACAFQLARAGVDARVFDAQPRVGGRIRSARGRMDTEQVCELGGELIAADHVALRGLCDVLELPLDDLCDDEIATKSVLYFGGERYSTGQIAEAFTPIAEQIRRTYASVGTFHVSHHEPGPAASLESQNLTQWLDDAGVRGWFRDLLEVVTTTEFGLDPDEQSALTFLTMLAGVEPQCLDPTFESGHQFRVRGGNDRITTRLGELLADQIQLRSVLEAVRHDAERYRLTFHTEGRSHDVLADVVVLALPFTTLRDVALDVALAPAKRRAITELGYGTNAKLVARFRNRVWRTAGSNGSVVSDLPFQCIWEATRLQPGDAGLLVSFTGGRRGVAVGEDRTNMDGAALARAIEAIFPGAAPAYAGEQRFCWPRFAWTKGSYSCYRPGQRTAFGGAEATPEQRLFFAGEHTAKTYVGFMEGACESGLRAANEVLAVLRLPAMEAHAARVAVPTDGRCMPC